MLVNVEGPELADNKAELECARKEHQELSKARGASWGDTKDGLDALELFLVFVFRYMHNHNDAPVDVNQLESYNMHSRAPFADPAFEKMVSQVLELVCP